ncbi:MAG: tetratricopeptide repeat protein [Pseudomonadota bacterium]
MKAMKHTCRLASTILLLAALIACSTPKQEGLDQLDSAEVVASEIPDDVIEVHRAAVSALQNSAPQTAIELLREPVLEYPQYAALGLNLGIAYFSNEQQEEAQGAFEVVLQNHPGNAVAHNYLGLIQRRSGFFGEARESYQRAISGDETYSLAHLNLGILCDVYLQDLDCALKHYNAYEALQGEISKEIKGWIIDLQRRMKNRSNNS